MLIERKQLAGAGNKMDTEGRTIYGYFSTWGVDQVGDRIKPGAFAKTISERGPRETEKGIRSKVKLGLNHRDIIGIPVLIREDDIGAYYEGKVSRTRLGDEVLEQVKEGSLDANSFSFDVLASSYENNDGDQIRVIEEVRLYELGPVHFPANEAAEMIGAKSLTQLDPDAWKSLLEECKSGRRALTMRELGNLKSAHSVLSDLLGELTGGAYPPPPSAPEKSLNGVATDEARALIQTLRALAKDMKGR